MDREFLNELNTALEDDQRAAQQAKADVAANLRSAMQALRPLTNRIHDDLAPKLLGTLVEKYRGDLRETRSAEAREWSAKLFGSVHDQPTIRIETKPQPEQAIVELRIVAELGPGGTHESQSAFAADAVAADIRAYVKAALIDFVKKWLRQRSE